MPTNPNSPVSNAAVDRLTLGIDSPRGAQPSVIPAGCMCFEAETSAALCEGYWQGTCFEAEASGVITCTPICGCFETE